jgi:hypothetical protein
MGAIFFKPAGPKVSKVHEARLFGKGAGFDTIGQRKG